jgi:hypothetical protein
VQFTFKDGVVSVGKFKDYDEFTEHIKQYFEWMSEVVTMEVGIESSDNN